MIKCKDCKHWHYSYGKDECFEVGECRFVDVIPKETDETQGCTDGERADGLTECCATCKHKWPDSAGPYCHQGNWHHNVREDFRYDKMKCDEWEAK